MSSHKSTSSFLDPNAMLDQDDQLDYEPDFDDDAYEQNVQCSDQDKEQDNTRRNDSALSDQDYRVQVPEPSGQEYRYSNRTSSEQQSLSYGTDLDKTPSVSTSYREKINYRNSHINVEKGSCHSKFGLHSRVSESLHLDSSDEEEEKQFEGAEGGSVEEGLENCENLNQSQVNFSPENSSDPESYEDSLPDPESHSYHSYYPSSDSRPCENMVSPTEGRKSPQSTATTVRVKDSGTANVSAATNVRVESSAVLPNSDQTTSTNVAISPQKKRTSLNFSIKVVGDNERIYIIPKMRVPEKKHKAWVSKVENYMDGSDIVKLTSKDEVIKFEPESLLGTGIKSRLGLSSSDKSSFTSESSDTGFAAFKVPLKRPPTRQKGSSKNLSVSVNVQSSEPRRVSDNCMANNQDDKDDILSLLASSCQLSTTDEVEEARDPCNNNFFKEEELSLQRSLSGTEKEKLQRTAQWVSKAYEPTKTSIPSIYRGLCFRYFFHNQCDNKLCSRSHVLLNSHTQINQLPYLNIEGLKEAYEFAKENSLFYGQIYKLFAKIFAARDMKGELIKMVNIIFEECSHRIDQEEGLSTVLNALQSTNLTTFEDTVDFLLIQLGLKRYESLGNCLLEIICKKPDLSQHWPILKKLFVAGEKMNSKLGAKFLIHLMNTPVNLKVCQEVYRHILSFKCINLPEISTAIREPFLKICSQEHAGKETAEIEANVERHLQKERFNFEKAEKNNSNLSKLPIQHNFAVPRPTTGFGRLQLPPSLNYIPPTDFGSSTTSHQPDFASLSRQETSFAPQSNFFSLPPPAFDTSATLRNGVTRSYSSGSFHDVDFRQRPSEVREQRYNANQSSEGDQSPVVTRHSDSGSSPDLDYFHPILAAKKRPAPTVLMYNKEGLHYDPANDYVPPPKRRDTPPPHRTEFDRLKESSGAVHTFHQNEQGPGLSRHSANHDDSGAGPTFNRTNLDGVGVAPAFHRPNQHERGGRSTFNKKTFDSVEEALPIRRASQDEQQGRPRFNRTNSDGVAFRRSSHDEQRAGPSFNGINFDGVGVAPALRRASPDEQEAGPTFNRTNFDGVRTRPTFNRPNRHVERVGPAQNLNTTNSNEGVSGRRIKVSARNNNEAAVSSSCDAKLRDEKAISNVDRQPPSDCRLYANYIEDVPVATTGPLEPPEHPQFGILYFDPNYEFNVSLHNLYLQAIDNVDIDEQDVHKLYDCVRQSDGKTYLTLIEKYKGPKTVQNFISMTLAHLKGMNQMVARTYQQLLTNIEKENQWFYGDVFIRVILEVITMNLLFELFQRNMLDAANNFLNKFSNWDSLVTSRLFINNGSKRVSIIGRYLFLAKILNYSKPEMTYEILVCPTLHLLDKIEVWPYHPPCPIPEIFLADREVRDSVISNFLKTGYLLNTVSVIQLYKTAFRKKIWEYDVKPYVDPMVIDLINKDKSSSLKQINNEINIFYKYMGKNTLRAFLISIYKLVSEKDLFFLYDKCVDRKIYQRLVKGDNLEYTIEIRTNMQLCEIELILKYYFSKLAEIKKVPSGSAPLKFDIKLPGETTTTMPILNSNKSLVQISTSIELMLKKLFSLEVEIVLPSVVEVSKEQLVNYLEKLWT